MPKDILPEIEKLKNLFNDKSNYKFGMRSFSLKQEKKSEKKMLIEMIEKKRAELRVALGKKEYEMKEQLQQYTPLSIRYANRGYLIGATIAVVCSLAYAISPSISFH